MIILGIDPSIRCTGFGIIDATPSGMKVLASGTVAIAPALPQTEALARIQNALDEVIRAHHPQEAAIEKIIYVQSRQTAIIMGSARGAALATLGHHGLGVTEYPAKLIKSAATGFGAARKQQVAFMVRAVLGMDRTPVSDEADALAIALTHARRLNLKQ